MKRLRFFLSTIDQASPKTARENGLGLELAQFCTASNMDDAFPQVDKALNTEAGDIRERILHGPFNELFPCAIDPRARELARQRYRQAIGLAKRYHAEKVVIHGGFHPLIYYPVWYTEQSVIFWRDFLKEDPGVEIVLENVLEPEPGMILDIIKGVDDPRLRLCLDVGHVNAYSNIPVMDWLESCAPYISHLHLHNNDGSWDTHSPLPEGSIPMKALLERIRERCPDATITLELPEAASSIRWLQENGFLQGGRKL